MAFISDGESGASVREKLNSFSDLFPVGAQTEGNTSFVFAGDSLTTPGDGSEWPAQLMLLSQFSGRGTAHNYAGSGEQLSGPVGGYAANAYPYRPGQAGITKGYFFLLIGTNDLGAGTSAASFTAAWDSFVDTIIADGFELIAFTTPPRAGNGSYTREQIEVQRVLINDHIRKDTRWKYLIEYEKLIPNQADTYWWGGDQIHPSANAAKKLAYFINNVFSAGGSLGFPLDGPGPVIGSAGSNVPSNTLLTTTPRTYTAAQVAQRTALTYGASVTWNMDAAQSAFVVLGGNATIANPTNPRAGGIYELEVRTNEGSHTLAWGNLYRWPGGTAPTLSTGADKADLFRFHCDGKYLLGSVQGQNYDVYVAPNVIIEEDFAPVGSNQAMDGTAPDTTNAPGHTWTGDGTRVNSTGKGAVGAGTLLKIDSGLSDGTVSVRHYCDGWGGLMWRVSDASNNWIFLLNTDSSWSIYKVVGGSFVGPVAIGSYTPDTVGGVAIKVTFSGDNFTAYIDGISVAAGTDSFNSTSTVHGLKAFGAWTADNFVFSSP